MLEGFFGDGNGRGLLHWGVTFAIIFGGLFFYLKTKKDPNKTSTPGCPFSWENFLMGAAGASALAGLIGFGIVHQAMTQQNN